MEEERVGKDKGEAIAAARDDNNDGSLLAQVKGREEVPTSNKSKSCKGCLYYSSNLKFDSRNPLCVGITRSLPQDIKGQSKDMQDTQSELPVCIGIEVLVDKRVTTADSVPAPVHSREDNLRPPQPQTH